MAKQGDKLAGILENLEEFKEKIKDLEPNVQQSAFALWRAEIERTKGEFDRLAKKSQAESDRIERLEALRIKETSKMKQKRLEKQKFDRQKTFEENEKARRRQAEKIQTELNNNLAAFRDKLSTARFLKTINLEEKKISEGQFNRLLNQTQSLLAASQFREAGARSDRQIDLEERRFKRAGRQEAMFQIERYAPIIVGVIAAVFFLGPITPVIGIILSNPLYFFGGIIIAILIFRGRN